MANVNCPSYVQGHTARATRLDICGNPDFGPCAYAVSDGWITIEIASNVEDPDEFKQKNALGVFLVNQRSRPLLNWLDVTMTFQKVDFELFEIVTGQELILNDASPAEAIGLGWTESNFATANFSLELWMGNSEEPCPPGGTPEPYFGYNLLPWVVEGALGESITVTNDLITFTITGRTRTGTPWGTGPYDVLLDNTGTASPLFSPVPDDAHLWGPIQTQLAPPPGACGCQELLSA